MHPGLPVSLVVTALVFWISPARPTGALLTAAPTRAPPCTCDRPISVVSSKFDWFGMHLLDLTPLFVLTAGLEQDSTTAGLALDSIAAVTDRIKARSGTGASISLGQMTTGDMPPCP